MRLGTPVRSRGHWFTLLGSLAMGGGLSIADAQQPLRSFSVAFYNIQSGKGEPGLSGRPVLFTDNGNCTDPALPLNAWGVGFVQQHLRAAVSDPKVVALGLAEAWGCGSPSKVRQALAWKANSTERNGTALVARYGFAGAEEWIQLDTSLNLNPTDTMWVLRTPVCLDSSCSASINLFTAHWFADHAPGVAISTVRASYDRQAVQTADFLYRAGAGGLHILIGDLNTWEGTEPVCDQEPANAGLSRLRDAGYVDAWPLVHGSAEGFTGMTNRVGCGTPEGYVWKRPDYVWSPTYFLPLSIDRIGMVPAGDAAPSDHYGLVAEFPWPTPTNPPPAPPASAGAGEVVLHAHSASAMVGNWRVTNDATAAGGVRLWNPNAGVPKLTVASSAPTSYFELSFIAEAGRGYRLWIRGQGEGNYWANDSVFAQFSGSVNQSGTPIVRIGTSEATVVSVEEGSGMGLSGWGWGDNGYGGLGPLVYFAATGPQTIRIQQREDGISIDQIVLSPAAFLQAAPGAPRNDATIYAASTGGSTPPTPPPPTTPHAPGEIVLYAAGTATLAGAWRFENDATAAGGTRLWNPNAGVPKLTVASSAPTSYFELSFSAEAGRGYRLWIRGQAEGNSWTNDSVFAQFSGSVNQSGTPIFRIGTSGATVVSVEEGSGMDLSGWGWQDNGYGSLGPLVYFDVTGPQTIRIQQREDGISIDQIVLSASAYLNVAPGAGKNDMTILPR